MSGGSNCCSDRDDGGEGSGVSDSDIDSDSRCHGSKKRLHYGTEGCAAMPTHSLLCPGCAVVQATPGAGTFYALHCIFAEWQTTISPREGKHASGGQRFHSMQVEALKQVPLLNTRTL